MIKVFVGCAPNHEDAESQAVFEWSLRKHTKAAVEIEWMMLSRNPASVWYSNGVNGWQTQRWATPFSGFRWAIPEVCGFEGRAVYSDSDVIWLGDIAELDRQEIAAPAVVLAKGGNSWRYCVSLWDCRRAADHVPSLHALRSDPMSHHRMTSHYHQRPKLTQAFADDWNCLDGQGHADLNSPKLKALHYTDMSTQPQLRHALPRLQACGRKHWFNGTVRRHPRHDIVELFDTLLEEACRHGFDVENYTRTPLYGEINKASLEHYAGLNR